MSGGPPSSIEQSGLAKPGLVRATSGRSCSLAATVFFETQAFGVDEAPHRPVIDLDAAFGKLGDKAAQGEVRPDDPVQKPAAVLADEKLRSSRPSCRRRRCPSPGSAATISRRSTR
jgi:hypothetical protein